MKNLTKRFYSFDYSKRRKFNCGGLALGTYLWEGLENWDYLYDDDYDTDEDFMRALNVMARDCAQEIVENFNGNVRIIEKEEDAKRGEIVFFLRLAPKDYHFVLKSGEKYYQKKGATPFLEEMSRRELYSDSWGDRYISDIIIFARKRWIRVEEED